MKGDSKYENLENQLTNLAKAIANHDTNLTEAIARLNEKFDARNDTTTETPQGSYQKLSCRYNILP